MAKRFIRFIAKRFIQLHHKLMRRIGRLVATIGHYLYRLSSILSCYLCGYHNPIDVLSYPGRPQGSVPSSQIRWSIIEKKLPSTLTTCADIGCNTGFFSRKMARKGIYVYGYEPDNSLFRLLVLSIESGELQNVSVTQYSLTPTNIHIIPEVDCCFFLSVYHYWVQSFGWEEAALGLRRLWEKINVCMFFEMPDSASNAKLKNELKEMGETPEECKRYLEGMLNKLHNARITYLGRIITDFRPNEKRHLFKISREG